MSYKAMILGASLALVSSFASAQTTIARWTFETSIPTTSGPLAPEVGAGTATANTGGVFSNPAGWGSTESWSSTLWNASDYFQFQVSTVGFADLSVSWQQTGSNTGPRDFSLQYSLNGTSFIDVGTLTVTNDGWNTTVTPAASEKSFSLAAISEVDDVTALYLRITNTSTVSINGGTVATSGTGRIDNFTVTAATAVPEPSTYALLLGLGALGLAAWRRSRA